MSTVRLSLGKAEITAYPLVGSRAVSVTHVVVRSHRVWAKNAKGQILCTELGSLRRRSHVPSLVVLREDDITALGQLGVIDPKAALKLKADAEYRRDYQHKFEWLESDAKTIRGEGITLSRDWKTKLEAAAHRYARERQAARRRADRAAKAKAKAVQP